MKPRQRVAVYVLRRVDRSVHVLVFDHIDHPDAGTQIPAGGIEEGEDIETAAIREVQEESGLIGIEVLRVVGTQDRPYPLTGMARFTTFLAAVTESPQNDWEHTVSGGNGDDEGVRLQCRFVPVEDALDSLVDHQQEFLANAVALLK